MSDDPRLPELFEHAAGLPEPELRPWLDELGRREPELAREIAELLAAAPRGERLDRPAWRRLELSALDGAPASLARLGPYRIVREIGRGGMGRVFLAEQEEESFRRRVALKLLDRPALTDDDVRRFRAEVRILATLEHPGIARFLDGGRSPEGHWYLALEYVDGVDLIEHARRRALAVDARVRLFLAVLEAVAYAHERGVVHRDLKPGNILVGEDGRPRLLDFGISKLVDPESGEATATRTDSRTLTPAYASPEQFRGERATVASDVYSLGVVLYELLAGRRPFGDSSSSHAELERAVLERDPEPPSSAAKSAPAADTGPDPGDPSHPRPPRPRVGRQLDAVCLRALRKGPAERYASVAALAADLERHLEGRPVEALRGGLRYRAARLVRRHRAALAAAAVLALAAGALLLGRPSPGRDSFAPAGGASPEPRPFPIPLPGRLTVAELERRFAAAPSDLAIGAELVSALLRAGRVQEAAVVVGRMRQIPGADGDPLVDYSEATVASNLDEPQRALALLTRGLAAAESRGRGELLARIRAGRARNLSDLGRRDEAHAELVRARTEAETARDDDTLARVLNDLAIEELMRGDVRAGESLLEEGLAAARRVGDLTRIAAVQHNLAGIDALRGRWSDAEGRYREALRLFRGLESSRRVGVTLADLALALHELGRSADAAAPIAEAIETLRRLDDDTSLAYALFYRTGFEIDRGELDGVDTAARELEAAARESGVRVGLAFAEILRGRRSRADGRLESGRERFASAGRLLTAEGHVDLAAGLSLEAADLELEADEPAAAARLAEEAIAPFRDSGESELALHAAIVLARADARSGRLDSAARRLAELGPESEGYEGIRVRTLLRRARAEVARRSGDAATARRQLRAAAADAAAASRELDALALRLDAAQVELELGSRAAGAAAALAVAGEAERLGFAGLAGRARRLSGDDAGHRLGS